MCLAIKQEAADAADWADESYSIVSSFMLIFFISLIIYLILVDFEEID